MPIQFPSNPSLNQEYTYEGKVWRWDGVSWVGVHQETGIAEEKVWSKYLLQNPNRGTRLNSGYSYVTDQRRTRAGTIAASKHFMERSLDQFSSTLWTPAQISTALWLDANDSGTITLNGSTVSQWNDKSGNGRNATQATVANQPTYIAEGLNGKGIIDWDGSNDSMEITGAITTTLAQALSQDNTYSIAFVLQADVINNLPVLLHVPESNWEFLFEITSTGSLYWGDTPSNYRTYTSGTFASTSRATFFTCVKTGSGLGEAHAKGTLASTVSGSLSDTPAMSANFLLGSYSSAQYNYNGKFAEIVITNTALSTADRQRLEGYLAHKWGLASNLPSDHPYKTSPPTV